MGKIKSAWEIALEKAEKLGDLSPEERRKQIEDRSRIIGVSLFEKYISQPESRFFETALNQYAGEDRELIRRAIFQKLVDGIELGHGLELDIISQGTFSLVKAEAVMKTMDKIEELFQEYNNIETEAKEEIEREGREVLHQMMVSGTAINHINPQATEEWQNKLNELAYPFEERLNSLKQELLSNEVA